MKLLAITRLLAMALAVSIHQSADAVTTRIFLPTDGTMLTWFNQSVGISDDTAIIGSPFDDDNGDSSGSAYLFDVTTGTQLAKLTASDGAANDWFGWSVGISGDTAIVGTRPGSAYLFDVATGTQLRKLTASDGAADGWFGYSVDISGNRAIVGAPVNEQSGSAYVFDVASGMQIAKLTASDGAAIGHSVGISGDTAIVGAAYGGGRSGSAYLFDVTTGMQIAKLTASDGETSDGFGWSVDISGDRAIVGAPDGEYDVTDAGTAYLFDAATGMQLAKLIPDVRSVWQEFGTSVGISGDKAIVGSYGGFIGFEFGSAYVFSTTTGRQLTEFAPYPTLVGTSVGISGNRAIVAEPAFGSAYILDVTTVVPEPATLALASLAAVVAVCLLRRLKR